MPDVYCAQVSSRYTFVPLTIGSLAFERHASQRAGAATRSAMDNGTFDPEEAQTSRILGSGCEGEWLVCTLCEFCADKGLCRRPSGPSFERRASRGAVQLST